jgi:hypothetical protein
MAFVSARYINEDNTRVAAIDDQGLEWHHNADSEVGDWLRYAESDGLTDPYDPMLDPPPPPWPPEEASAAAPKRDYGAEIDALEARVAALEGK